MSKIKKRYKVICLSVSALLVATIGFMGVDKFISKERSLQIIDDTAVTTSQQVTAESSGNDGIKPRIDAKSAVLIDGSSGKVLYAQNEKKHLPPASVTKVMTLLLILEGCESGKISFDDKVTISQRAAGMGGSQMYMEAGEQHTVEELIKGVIMVSANDGCVALAEHLSGSVESFVDEMNKKARSMGLNDSNFVNTNGLPVADHYSCAYDIGMITVELMNHEEAHKWFTNWQEDIKVGLPGKESKFTLTNTNKLIRNYNGAIGVKTGFTQDAGYCLSGAAERNKMRLISVVMGCETSDIRFEETARLLDHGFAKYETIKLADRGDRIRKIEIDKGEITSMYAVTPETIALTVEKGSSSKIKKKIEINNQIDLPVKKGEQVGKMIIKTGDVSKEFVLVSDRDVKKVGFIKLYIRMLKGLL